ncbi:hypothetical protein BH11MYX3_BH11MYX3_39300 [soil metagenome]
MRGAGLVVAFLMACGGAHHEAPARRPAPVVVVPAPPPKHWERAIKDPALRRELLALSEEDQAVRNAWIEANKRGEHPDWLPIQDVDLKTTAALRAIVARVGWPGTSMVAEDGATAAWVLVQHAVLDPAFQREAIALMKPMIATGEVSEANYAYLYDRIADNEGRQQLYGTQFHGNDPAPIEDEAHVDARRAAIGLPSMAEYKQQIFAMYGTVDLPRPTATSARAAHAAQQWAACAERFSALAATVATSQRATTLHAAARCHALAGAPDLAFRTLDAAIAAGLITVSEVKTDRELASLHGDPRWSPMLASLQRAATVSERGLRDPALRRRLLALAADTDVLRTSRAFAAILAKGGWPTPGRVGSDGTHAAAVIAARADLRIQDDVLARVKPTTEIDGADYAILYDRAALARQQPQRYGTQFIGIDPAPLEDRANVDARRAEVGLPPLYEVRAELILARAPN